MFSSNVKPKLGAARCLCMYGSLSKIVANMSPINITKNTNRNFMSL